MVGMDNRGCDGWFMLTLAPNWQYDVDLSAIIVEAAFGGVKQAQDTQRGWSWCTAFRRPNVRHVVIGYTAGSLKAGHQLIEKTECRRNDTKEPAA